MVLEISLPQSEFVATRHVQIPLGQSYFCGITRIACPSRRFGMKPRLDQPRRTIQRGCNSEKSGNEFLSSKHGRSLIRLTVISANGIPALSDALLKTGSTSLEVK